MPATDPRIDAYIEKKADFAKPILKHLRQLIHKACPEVQETIKWGMPYFYYSGSILCGIAAFKEHCAFPFGKAGLMKILKAFYKFQKEMLWEISVELRH